MDKRNEFEINFRKEKLVKGSHLHWLHWLVVTLSLLLTIGAWYFAKIQVDEKTEMQFQRESDQVVGLISERLGKYEDALWSGVGVVQSHENILSVKEWRKFANTLQIDIKYPGINGIGLIYHVTPEMMQEYLEFQRIYRPEYSIHPVHQESEYFPITYIEPEDLNAAAVGLDIAHENNRYVAAKKARETGLAQITGPIVLVQDEDKTAGFLLYVPYYRNDEHSTIDERLNNFSGMVYAPFVVKHLIYGTLDKQSRHVGLSISDGDENIYNEHSSSEPDFDPNPLFTKTVEIPFYGRVWSYDIRSTKSFREATKNNQPLIILFGGILIDAMLLTLFVLLSRSSRNALEYAEAATHDLVIKSSQLERSNQDLEYFSYIASHELKEPLRTISSFIQLFKYRYEGKISAEADEYINYAVDGSKRMSSLLDDLLKYSRIDSKHEPFIPVDMSEAIQSAINNLQTKIEETETKVTFAKPLPTVIGDKSQLVLLMQNLLANGIKFMSKNRSPNIDIQVLDKLNAWEFSVRDNGIGIDPKYTNKIFVMFQRLHTLKEYEGTGIGLAFCKKIVLRHGGDIWFESDHGAGTTFHFTIPKAAGLA